MKGISAFWNHTYLQGEFAHVIKLRRQLIAKESNLDLFCVI